jgi:hypothetical protein
MPRRPGDLQNGRQVTVSCLVSRLDEWEFCLDGAIPVGKGPFCSGRNRVADWTARGYAVAITVGKGFSRVISGEKAASCTSSRRAAN